MNNPLVHIFPVFHLLTLLFLLFPFLPLFSPPVSFFLPFFFLFSSSYSPAFSSYPLFFIFVVLFFILSFPSTYFLLCLFPSVVPPHPPPSLPLHPYLHFLLPLHFYFLLFLLRIATIEVQIAKLDSEAWPGLLDPERDRLILINEKEELLKELQYVNPRQRLEPNDAERLESQKKRLERDLQAARDNQSKALTERWEAGCWLCHQSASQQQLWQKQEVSQWSAASRIQDEFQQFQWSCPHSTHTENVCGFHVNLTFWGNGVSVVSLSIKPLTDAMH